MMTSSEAKSYAREHAANFERQLMELLTIPSISTLKEYADDCDRAARWLAATLEDIGMEIVEVIEGVGRPLVYADWLHAEGALSVLVYGHYDVQPSTLSTCGTLRI